MSVGRSRGGAAILSPLKRAILLIFLATICVLIFISYKTLKRKQIENIAKSYKIEEIESEIAVEEERAKELGKKKDASATNDDYESLARELGLIKKDEIVIKPR